jgi:hypothetical protein
MNGDNDDLNGAWDSQQGWGGHSEHQNEGSRLWCVQELHDACMHIPAARAVTLSQGRALRTFFSPLLPSLLHCPGSLFQCIGTTTRIERCRCYPFPSSLLYRGSPTSDSSSCSVPLLPLLLLHDRYVAGDGRRNGRPPLGNTSLAIDRTKLRDRRCSVR